MKLEVKQHVAEVTFHQTACRRIIKQHVAEVTFVVNIFKYANVFVITVFLYYILGDFSEIFKLASSNSN